MLEDGTEVTIKHAHHLVRTTAVLAPLYSDNALPIWLIVFASISEWTRLCTSIVSRLLFDKQPRHIYDFENI